MFIIPPLRTLTLTFIFALGLSIFFVDSRNSLLSFEERVILGVPTLSGFEEIQGGVFRAVKAPNEFHSHNTPIALIPDAYYRIRYDIRTLPREKVNFTADFYAEAYDNPEQERTQLYGMNELGKSQDFIINSGSSPSSANLRLFYSGAQGLEIANVQITRIATWSIWLKQGLLAVAFGALLAIALIAIQRFRNILLSSNSVKVSTLTIQANEVPALAVVYLFGVLVRYIIYITMPYWSGDEYVYKSIAAGIWHFGQHGTLTDTMVSYSVDLPNLLYPYLISPAFMLGENFYFGVRLINAIIINTAIFPCYLIARKFLDKGPALFAASISIAIPFTNLGAFAVTEVLFFPLFLLAIWVALESIDRPRSIWCNVIFGVVTAILLNVRLNALVLLPSFFLALLWISLRRQQALSLLRRPYWLASLIAFFGAYVCLQFSLGVRTIGGFGAYTHVVMGSEGYFSIFINNAVQFFYLIAGHFTTLAIPYALPIALIISFIASRTNKSTFDSKFQDFLIVISIFSSALFILTLIFTVKVSPVDLGGLERWHSRYYFYFYPLLIIAGTVFAEPLSIKTMPNRLGVVVIVILLLLINIFFIKLHGGLRNPWFGSIADNMDVQWYRSAGRFYWVFVCFTCALLWLWYNRSRYFSGFLVLFVLSWLVVSNFGTLVASKVGAGPVADACGSLSRNFLDINPGRFVIVGSTRATMVGAAFWNPYVPERAMIYSDSSKSLSSTEVGVSTDYLVVSGSIQVDSGYRPLISIGKCSIYELIK